MRIGTIYSPATNMESAKRMVIAALQRYLECPIANPEWDQEFEYVDNDSRRGGILFDEGAACPDDLLEVSRMLPEMFVGCDSVGTWEFLNGESATQSIS